MLLKLIAWAESTGGNNGHRRSVEAGRKGSNCGEYCGFGTMKIRQPKKTTRYESNNLCAAI
jgi:hypothetical protein